MESYKLDDYISPLMIDHYQMTMSYAYWKSGRQDDDATFEAFFRKHPFKGKYCIMGGVDEVIDFVRYYKFTPAHIEYLKA